MKLAGKAVIRSCERLVERDVDTTLIVEQVEPSRYV